ncbi:L,D-transpeptidase [Pseudogemmobacter humi]|uniref:Putative L,D-transpeptidase YnhG n=1 Tax=Pseudogemmobacter humi TaxID=2483812 RepID=A0A3P5XBD5_9RHOB|nr:L,D-transpeptidase [Pseudogemmobacter humi]VDC32080.1 putative L,D-transpeptidase YnhG precursor [Pseudogemmobacter humi]
MRTTGLVATFRTSAKAPLAALASLMLLSACVDPITGAPAGVSVEEQPAISTDATIYAARSDGAHTVPALPVEQIPAAYRRQVVDYPTDQPPGTIIIDPTPKFLYYVIGKNKAIRYGISVGAEGFQWSGESIVANKRPWPTWTPPKEMIERKPSLEKWKDGQPGGPSNPLGSRAIYLTSGGRDYGYRIHGTPEWQSIGRNASSGCFRMINQDVMDLYERVQGGEKVVVLTAKGEMPNGLSIPKPPAPKKKAEPKPAVTPAAMPPMMIGPMMPGAALPAADAAETTPAAGAAGSAPLLPAAEPAAPAASAPAPPAEAPAAAAPAKPACEGEDCPTR